MPWSVSAGALQHLLQLSGSLMRSVILTQELMGVVLKLTRKPGNMGSFMVSWDSPGSTKVYGYRKNFTLKVHIVFSLCFGMLMLSTILILLYSLDNFKQPWLALPRLATPASSHTQAAQHNAVLSQGEFNESSKVERAAAFQGLGRLFRRGTKSMNELVVAHLSDDTTKEDLRLFMRTLHRSGVTGRADVILLFPWTPLPEEMLQVIKEEESYFQEMLLRLTESFRQTDEGKRQATSVDWSLIQQPGQVKGKSMDNMQNALGARSKLSGFLASSASFSKFNHLAFFVSARKDRISSDSLSAGAEKVVERNDSAMSPDWGSVSGFELEELDPSDSLAAFLDSPSSSLRRWFAYQILLGILRHKYKHVLLTEVGNVLILGDALSAVRGSNLLYLTAEDCTWFDETVSEKIGTKKHAPGVVDRANERSSRRKELTGRQVSLSMAAPAESDRVNLEINRFVVRESELSNGESRRKIMQKDLLKEKASRSKGLMESVYGKEMWLSVEAEEKQNKMLVSNVLMGAIKPLRGLANAMPTQIVRVALRRKSRHSFSDQALLNYLVYRSSVLGKKIMDHLLIVSNRDSVIHSLSGSHQDDLLIRDSGEHYAVIENYATQDLRKVDVESFAHAVRLDLCSSPLESSVYRDCNQ